MTILKMTAEDYTLSAEYLGPMLEALQKRGIDEQEALAGLTSSRAAGAIPRPVSPP